MSTTTASAIQGVRNRYAVPPSVSTSRISCTAYATLDIASLAKMGNARRLGSSACPACSERTGLPMISRLSTRVVTATTGKDTSRRVRAPASAPTARHGGL
jgi:hypothetical protein